MRKQLKEEPALAWREVFLHNLLLYLVIAAVFSGGASLAVALYAQEYMAAASNLAITLTLCAFAASRKISYTWRARLFVITCFAFAVYMLPNVSILAHKYFIATTFLTALLLNSFYAHAFNLLCCACIFFFHTFVLDNTLISPRLYDTHYQGAFAISLNYAAIGTLLTIALTMMTRFIDKAYAQELATRIGLESERKELTKINEAMSLEIAARLQVESKLRETQHQMSRFLENVPHALFEYDCRKNCFTMYNSNFSKMFTMPNYRLAITDDELLELVESEDRDSAVRAFRQTLKGELTNVQLRMRTGKEGEHWFLISASPVLTPEMNVDKIVGTIQDIADLKRLEAANRHFQQRINEKEVLENLGYLAAGISHDFNNTLAVVLNTAELAKLHLENRSYEAIKPLMGDLIVATDRGRALSRQLLGFSKQKHVMFKIFDASEVIHESARMLSRVLDQGIRLHVTDCHPGLLIRFDSDMLDHAINNLVINARDAIDNEGDITISCCAVTELAGQELPEELKMQGAAGWVVVTVADTGHGMSKEVLSAALTPFFTTKGSGKGTGLGLANVQANLSACGGIITIDSEVGRGTRVNLCFPLFPENKRESEFKATSHREGGVVVLVDDDDAILQTTERTLVLLGHRVESFLNPLDCIKYIRTNASYISILITDLQMPEMHGVELARQVRVIRRDMPIIFISGYSDVNMQDFLDEQSVGCVFLEKPFKLGDFKAALSSVL